MLRNKRMTSTFLLGIFALALSFGFGFRNVSVARAQDKIVCDSTLISLLYISEHVYGHFPMTDVSNFELGQYAPLFEAMMAEMAAMAPTEEAAMAPTEEAAMAPTEEAAMAPTEEGAMGDMVMLAHGDVAGEPAECTALRLELDTWFYEHFNMEMMMPEGS